MDTVNRVNFAAIPRLQGLPSGCGMREKKRGDHALSVNEELPMRLPTILIRGLAVPCLALLAACNSHGGTQDATTPAEGSKAAVYAGLRAVDTLHFTGTEPFWGGSVTGGTLTYKTPEQPEGTAITVRRFAGNNGLNFSGKLGERPFDMAVTNAACSDGMSDRTYPFTVTLQIGGEMRSGCAWTAARGFGGPQRP